MGRMHAVKHHINRSPFEIWTVVACTVTGLLGLIIPSTRSGIINDLLPFWMATLWYIGLTISGSICFAGTVMPLGSRPLHDVGFPLGIERVGLTLLSGLLVGYGVALEVLAPGNLAGFVFISLSIASIGRILQIRREINAITLLTAKIQEEEVES